MDPSLTVVLLGHSGEGKSASGNTILGKTAFKSEDAFQSVTTEISEESEQVFNQTITVIDTPGILESEEKLNQIKTLCQERIGAGSPLLFLVVVKIGRFTPEKKTAVETAIRVIGDEELKNSFMLFTKGDSLNNKTLDDFINADPDGPLKELVGRFAGTHLFNNENGGLDQFRQLLEKSGHLSSNDDPREERRIILLGLPGDGKSASGNTILGKDCFTSGCGFSGVTKESKSESATVEGRKVTVVDTPGFTEKVLTPKQLYREIVKAIQEASPGPHAVIIVVRIGRISEAHITLFKMLPKLFGKDAVNYTMILFTYGDELRGQPIDDLIQTEKSLFKLIIMCGQRFCVFNNLQKANREQVRTLLDKVDEMVQTYAEPKHFTADMFYDVKGWTVTFPTWEECLEWFKRMLKILDSYLCEKTKAVTKAVISMTSDNKRIAYLRASSSNTALQS